MSQNLVVCILAAGRGTRMGEYAAITNKALLPLRQKAILTHIIQKLPVDAEIIIAVGYLENHVRSYLALAHPTRQFTFVSVANYEGPGSGPGTSLLACKNLLQRPFLCVTADTLWSSTLPFDSEYDWIGVAPVTPEVSNQYCNCEIKNGTVVGLLDKKSVNDPAFQAFVGIFRVQNHDLFWKSLERAQPINNEIQLSSGLHGLVASGATRAQPVQWTDVGTYEKYLAETSKSEPLSFEKIGEFFFHVEDLVIKFFKDPLIVQQRTLKVALKPELFPKIKSSSGCFYSYFFVPGHTAYIDLDPKLFQNLLAWLDKNLWTKAHVEPASFEKICRTFYQTKTEGRVASYLERYPHEEASQVINGITVAPVTALLQKLNWAALSQGAAFFIHGDLQLDNIIYDPTTQGFTLVDWRQDFGGTIEYGDIYYDLAKLYAGLVVNYYLAKRGQASFHGDSTGIQIKAPPFADGPLYIKALEQFITKKNFDLKRVKTLVGIIYLNMAALHRPPFDRFIFSMGRHWLHHNAELT